MNSLTPGVLASLLSAATAVIVARAGAGAIHPLWLLLAQYVVGALMSPPRRLPSAPVRLHLLRLAAGLWAFGGYYAALSSVGSRPSEMSMVLNTAPVFATFFATPKGLTRIGAVLAFIGVALTLGGHGGLSLGVPHALALTAAGAYATSIIVLGRLSGAGEKPSTTNSLYNAAAGICVAVAILVLKPPVPASWWPALAVGVIAAARIHILTVAAVSPAESARVSILSNLSFVWLAILEALRGEPRDAEGWLALGLVVAGVALASGLSSLKSRSNYAPSWMTQLLVCGSKASS